MKWIEQEYMLKDEEMQWIPAQFKCTDTLIKKLIEVQRKKILESRIDVWT